MGEKRKAVYNREADKRWRDKNKERTKYINYRSVSRSFIKNLSDEEDLKNLKCLIDEKLKLLIDKK